MEAYRRDKKSGILVMPGTGDCDTRILGPSRAHARAVRSLLVCRNEPDSIGRHEVYPSRATGEKDGSQRRFRGQRLIGPMGVGAY